ncbi:hypothetical protein ACJD0Z_04235 [Flavobacteriaceae bacterium M23B6Z8]
MDFFICNNRKDLFNNFFATNGDRRMRSDFTYLIVKSLRIKVWKQARDHLLAFGTLFGKFGEYRAAIYHQKSTFVAKRSFQ